MSLFGMFSSNTDVKEDRAIDKVFKDFDSLGGKGVLYRILKDSKCILGGSTVLLDYVTRIAERGEEETTAVGRSISQGLEDSKLAIFCHLSKSENLLIYMKGIISHGEVDKVGRERLNMLTLSLYENCGINEVFNIDFTQNDKIYIDGVDIYIVSDDHYLKDSLKVLSYDVLTSYIKLEGKTLKDRVFYTNYETELRERKATMLPEGAQEFYYSENQGSIYHINGTSNQENITLENIFFDVKRGEHTINLDQITDIELLGMNTDNEVYLKNIILSNIAESIIYDLKKGFFYRSDDSVGLSIDRQPNIDYFKIEEMVPYLMSLNDYKKQDPQTLFKLYAKACLYDYGEEIMDGNLFLNNYRIVNEYNQDYFGQKDELDLPSYLRIKYFFDIEHYRELDKKGMDSYLKLCFLNHISVMAIYYLTSKNISRSPIERKIFLKLYELLFTLIDSYCRDYKVCCLTDETVKKEVHMGIGVEPYIGDFLDDESYLDIEEFVKKDKQNHVILFLESGNIVPIHRERLLKTLINNAEEFIFYKCSKKFVGMDPLSVNYKDVDFTEPYFDIKGGSQEISVRVSELYSIIFSQTFNFFKLTKDKNVDRIAVLENISFGNYSTNLVNNNINIVSGYHCQGGVTKSVYRVSVANITSFTETERVKEVRKILTLKDVFDKYPEAKEIYDSTESKNAKILKANRLQIDGTYKNRLIQDIMSQRPMPRTPVESDAESDSDHDFTMSDAESDSDYDRDTSDEMQNVLVPTRLNFGDQPIPPDDEDEDNIFYSKEQLKQAIEDLKDPYTRQQVLSRYGSVNSWRVERIRDMSHLFELNEDFNEDISGWNVSNVEDMSFMFAYSSFDQDISEWDVSEVEDMESMFENSKFNQYIEDWDVSGVENMESMFANSKFNGYLGSWDVSNVTNMKNIFLNSRARENGPAWYNSGILNLPDEQMNQLMLGR